METSPSADLLSVDETCKLLGITSRTLTARIKKGLLRPVKIGRRYYFLREQVEYLARFNVVYEVARERLGLGPKEFAAWVEAGRIRTLKITAYVYVNEDDIKAAATLLKRFNMRITQAPQYGLELYIWRRYAENGTIHALFISTYCYVIESEIEKMVHDKGYTPYKTAKKLGISLADLNALVEQGLLRRVKTSPGFYRFYENDIQVYLSQRGETQGG